MPRISLFTLASGFALVAAAGCSSSGSGGGPLDGTAAPAAGQSLGNGAETSAGGFETGAAGSGASAHASTCQSGVETETQDGTTSETVTFANFTFSGPDGSETLNGSIAVTDFTSSGLVFTASNNLRINIVGAGPDAGTSADIKLTGDQTASFPATGTVFSLTDTTADSETIKNTTQTFSLSDSKSWYDVYTPGVAWAPGTGLVAGTLAISGQWKVAVNDRSAEATLASSNLQVDPTCATRIVAGTLSATWTSSGGRAADLTVAWTGCGVRTVSYTGP